MMTFGRMLAPVVPGVSYAPGPGGCLTAAGEGSYMVVEAYAIPASSEPWHDLADAMGGADGSGALHVGGVTVVGRDSGRVLARAYIIGDDDGPMRSLFGRMGFMRGDGPMAPMTPLGAD